MTPSDHLPCAAPVFAYRIARECDFSGKITGVDGRLYCRAHAAKLERELDAWAAEAAFYERVASAPDWLPAILAAQWRSAYRDLLHPEGDDPGRHFYLRTRAATRLYEMARNHNS